MANLAELGRNVEKMTEQVSKLAKDIVPKSPSTKVVEGTWIKPALKDFTSKSWDKLSSKEKGTIAQHYGYSPKIPPDNFTDLKLPHHRPSDGAAVGNGLRNALARLPQTKGISTDEKARIESHLNGHLKKLKKDDSTSKQAEIEPGKSHGEEEPTKVEELDNTPDDNMKDGVFTIPIIGEIGGDVTAEGINSQLAKADGVDVVFEIASPGGSVWEGVEIFNAIRNYKGDTTAKIMGMAASMASYIPLATGKVFAEDNAVYMIHNAWTIAIGDSEALKAESEVLESINETIAQAYVDKTGKKEKEVLQMMSDETWMFGDEIKKEGFADEMIDHSKDEKKDKGAEAKIDKDTILAEAKIKVKDMFLKLQKGRMKEDLDKIKQKAQGGLSKMEDKKDYISKLEDENVELVKGVIGKLNELAKSKEIKADDITKIAQELEASIIIKKADQPAHKGTEAKKVEVNDAEANAGKEAEAKKVEETKKAEEAKKAEETKKAEEAKKEEGKKDPKDNPDNDAGEKEEGKDKDEGEGESNSGEEDTSKQSEIGKGYKKVADEAVSKMQDLNQLYKLEQDKNETLTKTNIGLTTQISKFKEEAHTTLVNDVVDEICKFEELDEKIKIQKVDELSKMSDTALEVMKAEFTKVNVSKMENEEENSTEPSQNLEGKDNGEDSVSKMKTQEKEDVDKAVNRAFT